MKPLKNVNLFGILVYLVFAIFYFWMAAQVPYTHDDWDWGLDIGLQQLLTASINSRYAGNFFVVVMTRSKIAKTLIMGTGYFLLPLVLSETVYGRTDVLISKEKLIGFILCNILLLSMDISIWRQTYGWVAGYANFGISSIFLCIIFRQILNVFNDTLSEPCRFHSRSVALFLMCLIGQLFIENIAIYVFLTSIFVNCIHWYRIKRISYENISMFLAALLGLIIMFSSSLYKTLWSTGEAIDGYRQLWINSESSVQSFITGCIRQIIKMPYCLYAKNTSVCIAIIVLMSILWIQRIPNEPLRKICFVVNGLISACLLLCHLGGMLAVSVTSVVFFVAITAELIVLFKDEKLLLSKMFFIWISPICIILPLAMTSELGSRLFFTSNTVLILFTLFLLRFSLKSIPSKRFLSVALFTLACVILLRYGVVYYAIGECNEQRNTIIENAIKKGSSTIFMPKYPYPNYLWGPNPVNAEREQYFKIFYNIPDNISIVFDE